MTWVFGWKGEFQLNRIRTIGGRAFQVQIMFPGLAPRIIFWPRNSDRTETNLCPFRSRFTKKSLKTKPFVTNYAAGKLAQKLIQIEHNLLHRTQPENFIEKRQRNSLDIWAEWYLIYICWYPFNIQNLGLIRFRSWRRHKCVWRRIRRRGQRWSVI